MAKPKDQRESDAQFARVVALAETAASAAQLDHSRTRPRPGLAEPRTEPPANELRMMKKFRFQLLHRWLTDHIQPCRAADVGGGKGLLAYLLQESGWAATVIDPVSQALPNKYKDLTSKRQVRPGDDARVPRLDLPFSSEMARDFDLLIALHAHGCNLQLVEAAQQYGADLLLLPCCVIGEPTVPPPGVTWIEWVVQYVLARGFQVTPFRLNFKGQNIGIYARHLG